MKHPSGGLAVVEDRDDVRVGQLRSDARLEQEATGEFGRVDSAGEAQIEDLDRAGALHPRLLAEIDLAHPAPRDGPDDADAVEKDFAQERVARLGSLLGARLIGGNRRRRGADRLGRGGRRCGPLESRRALLLPSVTRCANVVTASLESHRLP